MLAAVQALVPHGEIDFDSLSSSFSGYDATARFAVSAPGGERMECEVITGRTLPDAGPGNIREFELNDARFVLGAGPDAQGVYCALIETPWGKFEFADTMRLTVREFLAGGNPIDAAAAVTNLAWLLEIPAK
jgi:hypothetical protein